jgi:hypothetical protein
LTAIPERLREIRVRRGWANLRMHLQSVLVTYEPLQAAEFVIRSRPPRDLEALEDALLRHLASLEMALHWVRLVKDNRDRPVSVTEKSSLDPEVQEALRS